MRNRLVPGLLILLLLGSSHFSSSVSSAQALSDEEFQLLSMRLSERPGHFGTDNLVSNEASFLHVKPHVLEFAAPGQAYVGVGPDQNFTYIAQSRPAIAFILDIRRDNLLHHLLYKAIMLESPDRYGFLALLLGRPFEGLRDPNADAGELVRAFEDIAPDREFFVANFGRLWKLLRERYPHLVHESDRDKLYSIAAAFYGGGLEIRYEIPGRPMLNFFPSFGYLMTETDLEGQRGHYLNSAEDYAFLRQLQERNRIVPVVGNFAGHWALKAIGEEIRKRQLRVSIFYLSNVEFYLFRGRVYDRFIDNVRALPVDGKSLFVRSYFNNWFGTWRTHPHAVVNYFSTSLAQHIERFLSLHEASPYRDYWEMVTRDYIGAPARPASVL